MTRADLIGRVLDVLAIAVPIGTIFGVAVAMVKGRAETERLDSQREHEYRVEIDELWREGRYLRATIDRLELENMRWRAFARGLAQRLRHIASRHDEDLEEDLMQEPEPDEGTRDGRQ